MQLKDLREVRNFCKDELKDYFIYKKLSEIDSKNKKILEKFSKQEYEHYKFWQRFLDEKVEFKLGVLYTIFLILVRRIFGITFLVRLLERNEENTINKYERFLSFLKGEEREKLKKIILEEKFHEEKLIKLFDDEILKYIGFTVLGVADAIIEVSGVHAGFLGLTTQTLIAGLAGLIVGFSASMSMGVAAYLQSTHSKTIKPIKAGFLTSISYIICVIFLAIPYFLTKSMIIAFTSSISVAIFIIMLFNFFSSVVEKRKFVKEFIKSVFLIIGVSFASFLFGEFLSNLVGLKNVRGI